MRQQYRHGLGWLACLALLASPVFAGTAAPWEDPNTPQLEIRQYRFSRHGGYDRLVLEFERKDANGKSEPKIRTEKSEGNWMVHVENSLLLGAIPESLINDLYTKKSRFMGPLTVNMDVTKGGFSLQIAMKKSGKKVKASWLANPPRLVIDGAGRGSEDAEMAAADGTGRETLSVTHKTKHPPFSNLMCFPAAAKVGLTVIFKPTSVKAEEMQNVRINTEGVVTTAPNQDAIVCYPKSAQIQASLSFETPETALAVDQGKVMNPTAPGGFGAPKPSGFGAPSAFGAPAGGGFGAPAGGGFGAPAGGGFGAAPAGGGFGAPAAGGFGAAPGGFGAPKAFGASAPPLPGAPAAAAAGGGDSDLDPGPMGKGGGGLGGMPGGLGGFMKGRAPSSLPAATPGEIDLPKPPAKATPTSLLPFGK